MTLRPCPFCGGEAELFTDETGVIEICVECKQCHARAEWSIDWNARVIPKGYVKVVRCGECRWLEERVVWQAAGGEASKMYICKSPHSHMKGIARFDGDYYCSEGEAKEEKGMNIAVDSKVKGRMPECVDMDIVVADAPNLTSDQISELAQPISPDTATQPGTLKTILQQLILINERLEKWEQTYIAYQEMQRVGSRPVYKKKEDTNDAV